MKLVVCHWTAGGYDVSDHDLEAYHFVIDGAGVPHRGTFSVLDNVESSLDQLEI